jgi:hypothetical protein
MSIYYFQLCIWSFFNTTFSNPSSLDVLIFNSFKVSLQGISSIPTHAFVVCVHINYFCNYKCECLLWHLVKMICSHINNYKIVCSCICNLYLWVMSIYLNENDDEKCIYINHF